MLGFLFQLTLLRAHEKGDEQGPSIGKQEERVSVPQIYGSFLSLRSPSHWSSQPLFPDPVPLSHSTSLILTGVCNLPGLDYSLSSPKAT